MTHILIVDDDEAIRQTLKVYFQQHGFKVSSAGTAEEGAALAFASNIDAIVSDIRLPGKDGLWLLREIKQRRPQCPVIMITAFHDLEMTVVAMQAGATDYVPKPIDLDELDAAVKRAVPRKSDADGAALVLGPQVASCSKIVGQSFAMKEVFKSIALVAQSRVTVMILGESGTGKELVARAVHDASDERQSPYIAVNCAALVESLLESELFGHERGAFTGAVSAHKGKIEQAGEGTLFLDEIAELSPAMQGKLLRILEEREYSPVGSTQIMKSKARFVAATNAKLEDRVASGGFREDLYYRLNVAVIHLPPLRERRNDIPLLVEFLLKKANRDLQKSIRRVSSEAMTCLQAYSWPGNVRQLENVLLKAVVMEQGDTLTTEHLLPEINCHSRGVVEPPQGTSREAFVSLRILERDYIVRVLNTTRWHKGKACQILGISRPRLERKIREFDLTAADDREKD
ncbi:sigma-54-dependent transcriptional regulator [Denitromonas halophila]|uniref:DNA-binding transcriptional regulator NtrC n=1 Tax=Denitromonas halophila TaxID=1629404 RepID=A0A557QSV8_9RHOO|nr:sigma-54 dependent transcriptional regulator [Denitromonas halophila]TVO55906.1 sigma-54-dependent Fis family transcriptional regulator [Denitromonas halophila]